MKRRTDLYDLIRAMSKSEKRYFTIDAQKSGRKGSRYLELFQAINDMEEEDEKILRKQFGRNLSTDKNYLYEAILRSMRDYRSANSMAARIREMLLDAKYLYERGLYDQCGERLESAKELARQLDDNGVLLEIIRDERRLILERRIKQTDLSLEELAAESEVLLRRITEENLLLTTYESLGNMVMRNLGLSNEEEIKKLKHRFLSVLTEISPEKISAAAQRRYYQCWAFYSQLVGNYDDVFQYYEKVIDWWDRHPMNKEEEFHRYIVDVSNYLHGYGSKGQYQYFPKLIESLENSKPRYLHDKSLVFQKLSIYRLMYFINTGENKGIDILLRSIEKGLSTFYINERSQFVLLFNTATLLFIQEDFSGCQQWCEKIFSKKKVTARIDIQRASRLLYLISEYEIDELDGTEKALRSINRYFHQQGTDSEGKNEFEELVMGTIQKLIFAPLLEEKAIFQQFITNIRQYTATHKVPLGLDELFLIWANGKLKKRQMFQLIKE